MKKLFMILPVALILCFMVSCQDKAAMTELEEFKAQAAVEEQNKDITKKIFEEIDKQNFDNEPVSYAGNLLSLVDTQRSYYPGVIPKASIGTLIAKM